jgi:protein dithiol:quinone oxidoreductase
MDFFDWKRLMFSSRNLHLAIFVYVTSLILFAVYSEHVLEMIPCSLCITQRFFFIVVGIIGLIAAIHNPKAWGRKLYPLLGLIFALIGAAFAARQLWLQSLPEDQVPACGPGLAYILEAFPPVEALKLLLKGDGNCAHVDKILGLSYALWSLIAFGLLILLNLFLLFRKKV